MALHALTNEMKGKARRMDLSVEMLISLCTLYTIYRGELLNPIRLSDTQHLPHVMKELK